MLWSALLACSSQSVLSNQEIQAPSSDTPTVDGTADEIPWEDPDLGVADMADWTFLIFMSGDNDLEPYVLHDLNELERGGSTTRVQVVVQADRAEGYATGDGDWTGARRYHIQRDADDTVIRSPVVASLGEVDMGDPQTLSDFLLWGAEHYPAENTILILWNHGDGWSLGPTDAASPPPPPTISSDDESGNSLSIAGGELAAALQPFREAHGPLALIGFDACNMGSFEVAHALRPYARYMVASEAWVDTEGYQYDQVLLTMQGDPSLQDVDVADLLAWSAGVYNHELTQAAVDLSRLDALAGAVDSLAGTVLDDADALLPLLRAARDSARGADLLWNDYYLDMADLAAVLQTSEAEPLVVAGADLAYALEDAVIANYTNAPYDFTGGLSIFADTRQVQLAHYATGAGATWAAATRWDELLVRLAEDP